MERRRAVIVVLFVLGFIGLTGSNTSLGVNAQDTLELRVEALEQRLAELERRVELIERRDPAQPGSGAQTNQEQDSTAGLNLTFEGSTDAITEAFVAQEGVLRFSAEYSGSSNFIVQIFGPSSSTDLVFNELGPYQGQRVVEVSSGEGFAIGVRAGEVFLEVRGQGPWRITVEQ